MMCATRRFFVLAIATLSWVATHGQSALSEEEWINALRGGGHVIVIRHGATPPDQADTDPLHLEEAIGGFDRKAYMRQYMRDRR
jgi:hypothetical protein